MDSVVATVSGYHGSERFKLIKLISQSGASYVGAMNPSTTHLVCRKFEGNKYELARKLKIIVVNHQWIEDCIKQGRRVSERPYTKRCGFEVGPLRLESQVVAEEGRSVFGNVSTTRVSKKPVIDIESVESVDDDWTDSWLLKENLLPDVERNRDHSKRLKRKGIKSHSRRHLSLINGYHSDKSPSFDLKMRIESEDLNSPSPLHRVTPKRRNIARPESSKGRHRLMGKNICNEVKSSDSERDSQPTEVHKNDVDIGEPSKCSRRRENRRALILEDLEEIEDVGPSNFQEPACTDDTSTSITTTPLDHSAEVDDHSKGREYDFKFSKQLHLSCVICWTDFSSTRGVLPCGHRFCFSCIQNWADHMVSMKKVSTCPLCKASFYSIQKMDDAVSSDQKIYSQTVPNDPLAMDVYVLQHGEATAILAPPTPVCYRCGCREPEELLVRCHSCQIRWVHSYCLDPPQVPWVCVQCKDLRMRYIH